MPIALRTVFALATAFSAIAFNANCVAQDSHAGASSATASTSPRTSQPDDTIELSFRDFFKMPIGPRGLEPSAVLQSLNNKRVRIVGYMVQEENPQPGSFMLSSHPVSLSDVEDGPADDLPATTISVQMPSSEAGAVVGYRPGLLQLSGTLELGNREESNGRVSYARLLLDSAAPAQRSTVLSKAP